MSNYNSDLNLAIIYWFIINFSFTQLSSIIFAFEDTDIRFEFIVYRIIFCQVASIMGIFGTNQIKLFLYLYLIYYILISLGI